MDLGRDERLVIRSLAREMGNTLNDVVTAYGPHGPVGRYLIGKLGPAIIPGMGFQIPEIGDLKTYDGDPVRFFLNPDLTRAIQQYQQRLVLLPIEQQAKVLRGFSSIDWDALISADGEGDADILRRIRRHFYISGQKKAVGASGLEGFIFMLKNVPFLLPVMRLAGVYARVASMAKDMIDEQFDWAKTALTTEAQAGQVILAGLYQQFIKEEEVRIQTGEQIGEIVPLLRQMIIAADIIGEGERSSDFEVRVKAYTKLSDLLRENEQSSRRAQEIVARELVMQYEIMVRTVATQAHNSRLAALYSLFGRTNMAVLTLLTTVYVVTQHGATVLTDIISGQIDRANMTSVGGLLESAKARFYQGVGDIIDITAQEVEDCKTRLLAVPPQG